MTRGVQWSLVCFLLLIALIALAGCSHYLFAEREPWRRDAEIACLNTGVVKETPQRVRISAISGPGICGMDYPLRIAALGDSPPLAYDADPPRPPGNHRLHTGEDITLCAHPQLGLFNKGRANGDFVRFRLAHPGLFKIYFMSIRYHYV